MRNKIIFVFGLPGSGKSYFASRLAQSINAQYVNSDQIRKELFKVRHYTPQEKRAVYNVMIECMHQAIQANKSIVLDATFHKEATRKLFTDQITDKSSTVFIEIQADRHIVEERLKKERPYSEADYSVHKLIAHQNEPLEKPHLILRSTNANIDQMLAIAHNYLQKI